MPLWSPVKDRVQTELIKRGHCVGCTRSLSTANRKPLKSSEDKEIVTCECGRVYIYDTLVNIYRRAEFKEVEDQERE